MEELRRLCIFMSAHHIVQVARLTESVPYAEHFAKAKPGIHAGRVAGGDWHHCRPHRNSAARAEQGEGTGQSREVRVEPAATGRVHDDVFGREQAVLSFSRREYAG